MNAMNKIKKALSLILVFVLVATLLPMPARAADTSRTADTIFFATDRHEESSKLNSLLKGLTYAPGLVVLGGDHVNNTNSGSLASITSEIQSVYSGVQTFYTYAAHDKNVSADASNVYAYARTGEYYEGEDYYVYAVDQDDMTSANSASTASAAFKSWAANTAKQGKVIFVMCHIPLHYRRKDNYGGSTWLAALNEAAQNRDIVYLWGHNHTGESSADTSVYYVARGGSVTPQTASGQGTATTINFTYMNAGYIKSGYGTLALINDDNVQFLRHNTSGTVTKTYTMTRQFAAHTHSWTVSSTVAATCGSAGSVTYTCSCGETKSETIAATGNHSYSSVSTGATCTQDGSVTYTCTVCGSSYTETVKANGHDYAAQVTAPTCVTSGYTTYTCTQCGDTYVGSETAALGHDYEAVTVDATCTTDGSVTYTCACGDTYTEVIKATGEHVYETVTVAATCTSDGSVTYTCGCGESYTEVIKSTGHAYAVKVTVPTCETAGCTTYTCSNCGDSYVTDEIEALGHAYEAAVTVPTCETAGCTVHTCSNCGDSYVTDEVEALGHAYNAVVTAATCETAGYTTHTCAACGDSYVDGQTAALGHKYTSKEENGYVVYTCGSCGDSYTEEILEASYKKVTRFSTGDAYVITVYSGRKYYALSHSGNKISAVQVTVSGGKVTSDVDASMLWTYSGGKLSYEDNGVTYYLYSGNSQSWYGSGNGYITLSVSTSNSSKVTFSSNKVKIGSYYLRYYSGTLKGYKSGTTAYLFEETFE